MPNSEKRKPDKAVVIRYAVYQMPGLFIIILVLMLLRLWFSLSYPLIAAVVAAWIAKDAVIFFYVWPAYDRRDQSAAGRLVGERGVAVEDLAPDGYVRIGEELWQAESRNGPVGRGERVRVTAGRGMKLIVEREE